MAERNPRIEGILEEAMKAGRTILDIDESKAILREIEIPVNPSVMVKGPGDEEKAKDLGFPVVLKVVSHNLSHKTDIGGVKVGIANLDDLQKELKKMDTRVRKKAPDADIKGYMVEEMERGSELIIGSSRDPVFGQMMMMGIGGVFVEIYKDVAFRLIPIERHDAEEMLTEIRGSGILKGARGLPAIDKDEMVDYLLHISTFLEAHPEITEMDINPMMLTKEGLVAVDARFVLQS